MERSEEWRDTVSAPAGDLFISCKFWDERLVLTVLSKLSGESRSRLVWSRTVERPGGKSLEECLEAALYRVARAAADGDFEGAFDRGGPSEPPVVR